jgi:hypothetical protein
MITKKVMIIGAIMLLGVGIVLYFALKTGKPGCQPGQTRTGPCGDTCIDYSCPSGKTYDCTLKKCVCSKGTFACKDNCCPIGTPCKNNLCCAVKNQCKSKDGSPFCCGDGEICNTTSNECVAVCGAKTCKPGETCLSIQTSDLALQNKFMKDFPDGICDSGECTACVPTPACSFSDSQYFPTPVTESGVSYYPCSDIITHTGTGGDVGYCSSSDSTKALSCYANTTQGGCVSPCTWRNALTTDTKTMNADMKAIKGSTDMGNWCGAKGLFSKIEKKSGSGCSVTDCWNVFNKDKNSVDIDWDGTNCTVYSRCETGGPVSYSDTPCPTKKPAFCGTKNYDCQGGQIVQNPDAACSNLTVCASAVQDNPSTGVGWCVTTNYYGVSAGSCAISAAECATRKPSGGYANFLTNASQCPDSCTIENMLYNSPSTTAVCDAPNLSITRGLKCMTEDHCDSGAWTAACYVVIENRCINYTIKTLFNHATHGTYGRWCKVQGMTSIPTKQFNGPDVIPGGTYFALAGPGSDNWSPDLYIYFSVDGFPNPLNPTNIWTLNVKPDANDCNDCASPSGNKVDYGKNVSLNPPSNVAVTSKVIGVMQNFYNSDGSPSRTVQGTRMVFYEPWQLSKNSISGNSMASTRANSCT